MKIIPLLFIILGLLSQSFSEVLITPDNPNLRYTGVVESEITNNYAKLYRHIPAIREVDGGGYWIATKAGNQAGMSIQFNTSSPDVSLYFEPDPNFESRWGMMALYRNGVLLKTINKSPTEGYEISVTGQPATSATWTFTFPGWKPMWFDSLKLADGYDLDSLTTDERPLLVTIGNSITHGVGQTGNATHLSYAWQVSEGLGTKLLNVAIGGSKINSRMLESINGQTPSLLTVLWGYNDVHSPWPLARALDSFEVVVDHLLTTYPSAELWIIGTPYSPFEVGVQNSANTLSDLRAGQLSIVEQRQASHSNLHYWDASTVVTSTNQLASDSIHLNDQGAADLAVGFLNAYSNAHLVSSSSSTLSSSSSLQSSSSATVSIQLTPPQTNVLNVFQTRNYLGIFSAKADQFTIRGLNLLGKEVLPMQIQNLSMGEHRIQIPKSTDLRFIIVETRHSKNILPWNSNKESQR